MRASVEERFWSKVDKSGECWEWCGSCSRGYGTIRIGKQVRRANRVAYELTYGDIPEGSFVCHKCDNALCVRPEHLFLGTVSDNNADMLQKGRQVRGEAHGGNKLTQEQVIAIRAEYVPGLVGCTTLGKKYGVSKSAIEKIIKGKMWKHIGGTVR